MPTTESRTPAASTRPGVADRLSGRSSTPAMTATTIRGTLTRNAACQLKACSSAPPTIGPMAPPTAAVEAHRPSAKARSRGSGKRVRISDRVAGMIIAPPTPSRARRTMTWAAESTASAASEARPKIVKPVSSIRRRPQQSATAASGTSRPASTSA